MGKSLLILKKNRALARELKSFLEENLWEVELGHSLREGIGLLRKSRFDVVLADYLLGDGPVSALTDLRESAFPDTRLIVVGVPPQKKRKPGDFLFKETLPTPFTLDQLKRKLDDVLDHSGSNHEPGSEQSGEKVQIVGESQAIKTIIEMIETFSNTDITVLITGESGTGKELVARALHQGSWRSGGPFVPLNCAAIPGELLESELFGHESGAFTDAKSMRKGKLQHADKGTFFLDEIGEMSHTLQAKLLRVLETKEVERLGSNGSITVDTRFVAATNAILTEKIQQGLFREDLYYRLRMVEIHVPPPFENARLM